MKWTLKDVSWLSVVLAIFIILEECRVSICRIGAKDIDMLNLPDSVCLRLLVLVSTWLSCLCASEPDSKELN